MRIIFAFILAFIAFPAVAGDTFKGFSVECSSTAWTNVVPVRAHPRRVTIHTLDSNVGGVCVGTTTASGTACDDSAAGVEFSTVSAGGVYLEFLTRSALNCRARGNLAAQRLKGCEIYDAQ